MSAQAIHQEDAAFTPESFIKSMGPDLAKSIDQLKGKDLILSAKILREESLDVAGQKVDCYVVEAVMAGAGGQILTRGRAVRIPAESLLTFRIERPLDMGIVDPGYTRDGVHYHNYRDRQ